MIQFGYSGYLRGRPGDLLQPGEFLFVRLRETKHHWITQAGNKFRKRDGSAVGDKWATLDLSSIKPVCSSIRPVDGAAKGDAR